MQQKMHHSSLNSRTKERAACTREHAIIRLLRIFLETRLLNSPNPIESVKIDVMFGVDHLMIRMTKQNVILNLSKRPLIFPA